MKGKAELKRFSSITMGVAPWLAAGPRRHIRNVNIKRATFHKKFKSSH